MEQDRIGEALASLERRLGEKLREEDYAADIEILVAQNAAALDALVLELLEVGARVWEGDVPRHEVFQTLLEIWESRDAVRTSVGAQMLTFRMRESFRWRQIAMDRNRTRVARDRAFHELEQRGLA